MKRIREEQKRWEGGIGKTKKKKKDKHALYSKNISDGQPKTEGHFL